MKHRFLCRELKSILLGCSLILLNPYNVIAGFLPLVKQDSDLIRFGPRISYYALPSSSTRWWQWGLQGAPVEDTTPFDHGSGSDAIAIPFDSKGYVTFSPVYIYTMRPDDFWTIRLRHLVQGYSTADNVKQLFGTGARRVTIRGYTVWYYAIPVHNSLEEWPSSFRD
jgi:hypothetical protein